MRQMRHKSVLLVAVFATVAVSISEAQTRTVIGRVTDHLTARPISYGRVTVDGLGISDIIRPDGVFVVRVPLQEVTLSLEVEGYHSRSVTLPIDQETAIISLVPVGVELEQVTVSAATPHPLTTSTARISGDEANRVPAQSVEQALQGKVPGADIQQNSGAPGGDLQLRLRGVNTILGAASPLYVLDGTMLSDAGAPLAHSTLTAGEDFLPRRIADLNPNDIESIEILKGASATTRYGSRGSNGVVIIKTKRGRRTPRT